MVIWCGGFVDFAAFCLFEFGVFCGLSVGFFGLGFGFSLILV